MSSRLLALLLTTSVAVLARPQTSDGSTLTTSTLTATATSVNATSETPTVTVSTSVPSPTLPLNATLPSQASLPPKQAWCPSDIFCAGALLQSVNLAAPYVDSKTFVDKPTNGTANHTLADFNALAAGGLTNITEGQIVQFLDQDFQGEGLELEALTLANFSSTPSFLANVTDPLLKAWTQTVHGFWTQLIRGTNASTLCTGDTCESSLIPLNHTFVVPGGRFREQYYWDSYFIVEGLIKSQLFDVVNSTLQNFMDELEQFGFIPNGGRIYYLNRSQPPLFIHMLSNYVTASGDLSILQRALPLAETELQWWLDERTINVTSPATNVTYAVAHYAVNNTAPRPESYLEDYQTGNGAGADDAVPAFTDDEKADIYAELASGAETGWDYSSRWVKEPFLGNLTFNLPALRTLNVRNTTPVDLNSILYNARVLLADLYELPSANSSTPMPTNTSTASSAHATSTASHHGSSNDKSKPKPKPASHPSHHGGSNTNGTATSPANSTATSPASRAAFHRAQAATLRAAILDLFWDPERLAFYDFNRTANARGDVFSAATFYPLWSGIVPDEVLASEDKAFGLFAGLNMVLNKYNGTLPVTFFNTGLQWDWPNTWPPHQYIAIEALRNLPANITTRALPLPQGNQTTFDLVPAGQLGINASQLFQQTDEGGAAFPLGADLNRLNGTVVNGGNATAGETWAHALARELSNRYMTSAFCSWHATGGSIPGILQRLPDDQLNITLSVNNTGNMFEKFSVLNVDSAGSGGEYTVQAGFGWTNGVVLWIAGEFGQELATPECPALIPSNGTASA